MSNIHTGKDLFGNSTSGGLTTDQENLLQGITDGTANIQVQSISTPSDNILELGKLETDDGVITLAKNRPDNSTNIGFQVEKTNGKFTGLVYKKNTVGTTSQFHFIGDISSDLAVYVPSSNSTIAHGSVYNHSTYLNNGSGQFKKVLPSDDSVTTADTSWSSNKIASEITAASGSSTLDELTDTTLASVAEDDILAYDTGSGKWINQSKTEAGFGNSATLDAGLSASEVAKIGNVDPLYFGGVVVAGLNGLETRVPESGFNKELGTTAGTVAEGNHTHSSSDLVDFNLTAPEETDILQFSGTEWKNKSAAEIFNSDNPTYYSDVQTICNNNTRACYSLHRMVTSYNGACIRIRTGVSPTLSSGEIDIGFVTDDDGVDVLDVDAIESFLNQGENVYLNTWYDQSGNSYNLTSGNLNEQPQIFLDTGNRVPQIRFDGIDDWLQNIGIIRTTTERVYCIVQPFDDTSFQFISHASSGGTKRMVLSDVDSNGVLEFSTDAGNNQPLELRSGKRHMIGAVFDHNVANGTVKVVNDIKTVFTTSQSDGTGQLHLGRNKGGFSFLNAYLSEFWILDNAYDENENKAILEFMTTRYNIEEVDTRVGRGEFAIGRNNVFYTDESQPDNVELRYGTLQAKDFVLGNGNTLSGLYADQVDYKSVRFANNELFKIQFEFDTNLLGSGATVSHSISEVEHLVKESDYRRVTFNHSTFSWAFTTHRQNSGSLFKVFIHDDSSDILICMARNTTGLNLNPQGISEVYGWSSSGKIYTDGTLTSTNAGFSKGDILTIKRVQLVGSPNDKLLFYRNKKTQDVIDDTVYALADTEIDVEDNGAGSDALEPLYFSVVKNTSTAGTCEATLVFADEGFIQGSTPCTAIYEESNNLATSCDLKVGKSLTVMNDTTINGDLFVNGTTTTINTTSVEIEDPVIELAHNNIADLLDSGFYSVSKVLGLDKYSGLIRDASEQVWKLTNLHPQKPSLLVDYNTNLATLEAYDLNALATVNCQFAVARGAISCIGAGESFSGSSGSITTLGGLGVSKNIYCNATTNTNDLIWRNNAYFHRSKTGAIVTVNDLSTALNLLSQTNTAPVQSNFNLVGNEMEIVESGIYRFDANLIFEPDDDGAEYVFEFRFGGFSTGTDQAKIMKFNGRKSSLHINFIRSLGIGDKISIWLQANDNKGGDIDSWNFSGQRIAKTS